jgi:hypothetical protein
MHRWLKAGLLGLALAMPVSDGIAASKSPKLARCDGKQRRPANPYGSILPTVDPASGSVTPASARPTGVEVFPPERRTKPDARGAPPPPDPGTATQVPPISALTPATSYRSC